MEFPTSSSLPASDTNSVGTNNTVPIAFHSIHHRTDNLTTSSTTTTTTTRISSPALTPPTPISPREPQSPDGHTSVSSTGSSETISDLDQSQIGSSLVDNSNAPCDDDEDELIPEVSFDANSDFNLHFFDTPEDSSTQGGFSDPGSVESTSIESPPPPPPSSLEVLADGLHVTASSSSAAPLNGLTSCNHRYFPNHLGTGGEVGVVCQGILSHHGSGLHPIISTTPTGIAISSTSGIIGNSNGGATVALCNNPFTSTSRSTSSTSGSSSSSSLSADHFIGGSNHSSSSTSSASLVNVKISTDQQFAIADTNTNTVTKSFVPCKVCGDKASGYHYGVTSCEGCKGFFRRSIQKQIEYRCLRDGKCLVIRLNRNRCQYCRFKKCLSAGMSRDSVRYGRVPKRSRELNGTPSSDDPNIRVSTPGTPNTPQTPQMCSVASPPELGCTAQLSTDAEVPGTAADLSVYDIIMCVSQAHRMHCTYTEEQTRELIRRPIAVPQNGIATTLAETLEFQKIWLWQQYAARITPGVQRIVEFAKRVPGFCDFTQDDQLILIKLGFFEIWLSHVARMITDATLTFDDGTYLTRQQLEILYDNDFVISLTNFANTLNGYNLGDPEIGLFSAMVLLASDRSGLTDPKAITKIRERATEGLRVQLHRSRGGPTPALQLMPALEAKIPELRSLGAKHFSHLDWLRMNWTKLRLPPLFAEIFDIPKTEDDL